MKVSQRYKIESACSPDKLRLGGVLTRIALDCSTALPVLVATDGHILAVVPAEACKEEAGFVTAESLKAARKATPKKAETMELLCNGSLAVPNGPSFPRPNDGLTFPRWQAVIPTEAPVLTVAFDVALLVRLAEAIGSDKVVLEISNPNHAIRVRPYMNDTEAYGVMMPLKH